MSRILPRGGKGIGPFLFLDHFGPWNHEPHSKDLDVAPHPHIGLSTLTYLFEGESVHRDSLGMVQAIRPGDVNWMTAGSGVVHSERVSLVKPQRSLTLHGLQAWVALPDSSETIPPRFEHYDRQEIPMWSDHGVQYSLLAGQAFGRTSPVNCFSRLFYIRTQSQSQGLYQFEPHGQEAGFYLMEGSIHVDDEIIKAPRLILFKAVDRIEFRSNEAVHGVFLGGDFLGERHMNWNFVSSSRERISQAREDWKSGRFPSIEGENERIPLPENK